MGKRAIVYLDGYNFYYGCLRNGEHKWLDIVQLFKGILHAHDPNIELIKVKYFTSPALARYARHGVESEQSQTVYHNALKQLYKKKIFEIILGKHELEQVNLPKAIKGCKKIDRNMPVRVWKTVEKKTDIQLSIEMYADAAQGQCDIIVICTNDSDIEPALQRILADYPTIEIGFIAASRTSDIAIPAGRQPNKSIQKIAHWTRRHILDAELAAAQMSPSIKTRKGTVSKPAHWFPQKAPSQPKSWLQRFRVWSSRLLSYES